MDYQKVYTQLISKRITRPLQKTSELYTELHHIVPRCLGGSDVADNLVRLTAREHFVAHRLLANIHKENSDLALSVLLMQYFQGEYLKCSKEIARLKGLAYSQNSNRLAKLWENPEFKSSMSELTKERNKQMWNDESFKSKMSTQMKEEWKKEDKRELFLGGQRRFLDSNPWPWQRVKKTKEVWALAATFWELSRFNPKNEDKKYGYLSFCKDYFQGRNQRIFQNMFKMFESGWHPKECEEWLREFSYKM